MEAPMSHPTEESSATRAYAVDTGRVRCRSFCFLEREGTRYTAFLITYPRSDGRWRGYFTFRSPEDGTGAGDVRTADLFLERDEQAVDQRARGLGRPLLSALLDSALSTAERRRGVSPELHRWLRQELTRSGTQRASSWQWREPP